jgi:hypothetical protein
LSAIPALLQAIDLLHGGDISRDKERQAEQDFSVHIEVIAPDDVSN